MFITIFINLHSISRKIKVSEYFSKLNIFFSKLNICYNYLTSNLLTLVLILLIIISLIQTFQRRGCCLWHWRHFFHLLCVVVNHNTAEKNSTDTFRRCTYGTCSFSTRSGGVPMEATLHFCRNLMHNVNNIIDKVKVEFLPEILYSLVPFGLLHQK